MRYYDVWKKKISTQGVNETQVRLNSSKELIKRNFRDDPSYKSAILSKLDLTQEPIDIRIKNVDRTTSEKKLIFLPDEQIDVGSFVKFDNKTFLIKEFEDNSLSPYAKGFFCNQTLNWKGLDKPIPCWCDNSSYGTKGTIDTNLITVTDGKIQFFTQYNEKTAQIRQDMRFIFDNSKESIYKVADVNRVVTGNVLRIIMDKAKYEEGKDDVANNIAYNSWLENQGELPPTGSYGVKSYNGLMEVKKWTDNIFTVVDENGIDASGGWDITVDLNGSPSDVVSIVEKGDNYIKLMNNGYIGYDIVLKFIKDTVTLTQIVKVVR